MARTISIDQAVRGLNAFASSAGSVMLQAVRAGLEPLRAAAEQGARRTRVGTALFGRKGLRPILAAGIASASGTNIKAFVDAKGFAALIEQGGRTKAHPIDPRGASVLRFVSGGRIWFAKHVDHRGSQFKREEFMQKAAEGKEGAMAQGIDQGLQASADRLIG